MRLGMSLALDGGRSGGSSGAALLASATYWLDASTLADGTPSTWVPSAGTGNASLFDGAAVSAGVLTADGVNDSVTLADVIDTSADCTIGVRFRWNGGTALAQRLFSMADGGTNVSLGLSLRVEGAGPAYIRAMAGDGTVAHIAGTSGTTPLTSGEWVWGFIEYGVGAPMQLHLYREGGGTATAASPFAVTAINPTNVPRLFRSAHAATGYCGVSVTDFAVWNGRLLTADERAAVTEGGGDPPAASFLKINGTDLLLINSSGDRLIIATGA